MDSPSRTFVDLDLVAVLLATRLGTISDVLPPANSADVVSFVVNLNDPEKAAIVLADFAAGSLQGNIPEFVEALDRVRRMVRDARTTAGYGRK